MSPTTFTCGDVPYLLEVDEAAAGSLRGLTAVLQLPDGLKPFSEELAECLESRLGASIIIQADSVYGACDLQYPELAASIRPHAILHVGHTPYPEALGYPPLSRPPQAPKVVFVAARYVGRPSGAAIKEAARIAREHGAKVVGLVTTAQHTHIYGEVASALEGEGLKVKRGLSALPYFEEGQIIGCEYSMAPRGVDAYVYLGGGEFHPVGLYLATLKPVIKVDPYRDEASDVTPEGERVYRVRLDKVRRAFDASRWGVVVGTKTGQYRPWLVERLVSLMRSRGLSYRLIAGSRITPEVIANLDSRWYEAFVVTACPRIPIDDMEDYPKPVLTPGEAVMAITRSLEPYRFPW